MKIILSSLMCFAMFILPLNGQVLEKEVLAAAGWAATVHTLNGNYLVSWSLGEVLVETYMNLDATIYLAQGFQQPEQQSNPDTTNSINFIQSGINIKVYPNPSADLIIVELDAFNQKEFTIQLFDSWGREIQSFKSFDLKIEVDLVEFPASYYFLKISSPSNWQKTVKIIKQ